MDLFTTHYLIRPQFVIYLYFVGGLSSRSSFIFCVFFFSLSTSGIPITKLVHFDRASFAPVVFPVCKDSSLTVARRVKKFAHLFRFLRGLPEEGGQKKRSCGHLQASPKIIQIKTKKFAKFAVSLGSARSFFDNKLYYLIRGDSICRQSADNGKIGIGIVIGSVLKIGAGIIIEDMFRFCEYCGCDAPPVKPCVTPSGVHKFVQSVGMSVAETNRILFHPTPC